MKESSKVIEIFLESCFEQLKNVETLVLDLETAEDSELQQKVTSIFRAAHSIKGDAGSMGLERISSYAHAIENVLQLLREGILGVSGPVISELLHGFDRLKSLLDTPDLGASEELAPDFARLETLLVQQAADKPQDPSPATAETLLPQAPPAECDTALPGETMQEQDASSIKQIAESFAAEDKITRVTIPALQLDILVDRVGELAIAQSKLGRMARSEHESPFLPVSEEIESLCNLLRDQVLGLRLLPLQISFAKYRRLVRDLCTDLGKKAEFAMNGQNTELDKRLIEELNTPLIHLLRNAVDHGIETPEERETAGKSRQGHIELSASQLGTDVVIEIKDDGAGIDGARIEDKARQLGLLPPQLAGAPLSEEERLQLIFLPGLSTSKQIGEVSGRGVGMDAVKASVQTLRGRIDIFSTPGTGTTFRIQLPVSMAIIDCLRVDVAGEDYFMHLDYVEECIELQPKDGALADNLREYALRDEHLPLICLRTFFAMAQELPQTVHVVVVRTNQGRFGVVVDHVVGQHQAVLRQLGPAVGKVEGILGATVTETGAMGLILDMPTMAQAALREEGSRWSALFP